MRYYIIAGERSGDLHAGNLVKAIKATDNGAIFKGFGGDNMSQEGVVLTVHYRDLAFMGLVELITNATKIRRYIKQCKEDIIRYKPDVIILVDYGGFNLQIARFGKKEGFKIFYYIAPKYWAWYQNRARWLKPYVDRLFVILPFEKNFFKKFDWESDYVGNPVLDAVLAHNPDPTFLNRNNLLANKRYVALLPGSRKQELNTIIPLMAEIVKQFPHHHFLVAAVNNLDRSLYQAITSYDNVTLIFEDTYNLLINSAAGIVTSGTATLEAALFKVPQIVVYKANPISYWLARAMVKVRYISLVNLIVDREVVREMIQSDATVGQVSAELRKLLDDIGYRVKIENGYDEIIRIMYMGSASVNTAELMRKYLNEGG
ncbi:MAG: lipid-A-disaccharide synthase [Chryseolinea sp.]